MSGIDRHASVHPLCLGWDGLGLGWSVQPLKLYVEQTTIAGAADVASLLPIPLLLPLPFAFAFALPISPLPSPPLVVGSAFCSAWESAPCAVI